KKSRATQPCRRDTNSRCQAIMEEITPGRVKYHRGWKHFMEFEGAIAKEIALDTQEVDGGWVLRLHIHPGDVMSRARAMYKVLDQAALLELDSTAGWHVRPNFHIAFRASNLVWGRGPASLKDYLEYWQQRAEELGQIRIDSDEGKAAFEAALNEWIERGFVLESERADFLKQSVGTQRKAINICPGVSLFHTWSKSQAEDLDAQGTLVDDVREKMAATLATWAQPLA
ncbi:hypothetical protein ACFL59_16135, partial [Planctomycetota bacterium]